MKNILYFVLILFIFGCKPEIKEIDSDIGIENEYVQITGGLNDLDITSKKLTFNKKNEFTIINYFKSSTYPSSDTSIFICEPWNLSKSEIKKIINDSDSLSGEDWHHLFTHYPCEIKGTLKQNEVIFEFAINAGSWLTISSKDSAYMFANFNKKNEKLFLSTGWTVEDMEN